MVPNRVRPSQILASPAQSSKFRIPTGIGLLIQPIDVNSMQALTLHYCIEVELGERSTWQRGSKERPWDRLMNRSGLILGVQRIYMLPVPSSATATCPVHLILIGFLAAKRKFT